MEGDDAGQREQCEQTAAQHRGGGEDGALYERRCESRMTKLSVWGVDVKEEEATTTGGLASHPIGQATH